MNFRSVFFSKEICDHIKSQNLKFDALNTIFVGGIFLVAFLSLPFYFLNQSFHWGPWILAFVLYWVTGLGITMGYHRYFSHRTYDANPIVEFLLLVGGAMALQNSALKWSADHRKHHSFTDTAKDPYNAKLGFWWSHVLWIFYSEPAEQAFRFSGATQKERLLAEFPQCHDLVKSRMVRMQHACSIYLGLILSFVIPLLFGLYFGDVWGYLLVAGFLRITAIHNSTFFINSLAHIWGKKPYSDKDTSRDSTFLAFFALGEGYHNYHHAFPNDYRNGIAPYHFDPTKWLIKALSWVGLTQNLRVARR